MPLSLLYNYYITKKRKEFTVDWNKLKAEYVAGGTSYRKLAKKYNVSFTTLQGVAKREKWCELRRQAQDKTDTKIVNTVANDIAKKSLKINDVADKLLDKISLLLEEVEGLDTQSIKHLTSSLKDLKDIKGIKSDIDLREQEARIDKLRKETKEEEQKDTSVEIIMDDEVDGYAN